MPIIKGHESDLIKATLEIKGNVRAVYLVDGTKINIKWRDGGGASLEIGETPQCTFAALKADNKRLRDLLNAMLDIKACWLPPDNVAAEHHGEAAALQKMYQDIVAELKEG